jgi:hypothetical protein
VRSRNSYSSFLEAANYSALNLLGAILIPIKHVCETERLFDFSITRQLARNHQRERTACLSEHAVPQFVFLAPA